MYWESWNWFILVDINKQLIACIMLRYYDNNLPKLFNLFFEYESDCHSYNTRTEQHIHIQPVKTCWTKTNMINRSNYYEWYLESRYVFWICVWKYFHSCRKVGTSFLFIICMVFCIHQIIYNLERSFNVLSNMWIAVQTRQLAFHVLYYTDCTR